MPRFCLSVFCLASFAAATIAPASADPAFVNGLRLRGDRLDATGQPGANAGRLGFFSDIYFDPVRDEWWALSDRGPGGGLLTYPTRVQRFSVDVDRSTGRISRFRVERTVKFTDPNGLLSGSDSTLNGQNPLLLNGDAGILGNSFDPEGLVVDPRTGHLLVADEYGPSLYEFDRRGRLRRVFETPANLIPKKGADTNYVADRDGGLNAGRQDNRGFEGLAITPDGKKLFAVMQDPLINEPGPNNGRNGRNVRIVVFDNNRHSWTYGSSIAQYAYQLEPQADVANRINAQVPAGSPPDATPTDPRQGRNIGLSAIVAVNDHEFLVLERDNRGIGVDDPRGAHFVGSKRVYRIDITGATDVSAMSLPIDALPAGVNPVSKTGLFIDLARNTLLPNGKLAEKWEGLTIGPRLSGGAHSILAGNDNDYSVTQTGSGEQFDVYVDFQGNFAKCVLDDATLCEVNPAADDTVIDNPAPLPDGYSLLPGVLHAYRASSRDLRGYVEPRGSGHDEHDDHCDDDRDDHHHD